MMYMMIRSGVGRSWDRPTPKHRGKKNIFKVHLDQIVFLYACVPTGHFYEIERLLNALNLIVFPVTACKCNRA